MTVSWIEDDETMFQGVVSVLNNPTLISLTLDATTGTKIDMNDLPLENVESVKMTNNTSEPSSPAEGWMYYNSTDKRLYFYNGYEWEVII